MTTEFNINEICRTCLTKSPTLVSIFDNNPALNSTAYAVEFLTNFCKVSLASDNNLPSKVCPLCAEEIKRSYAFKIKCERSAEILKRYAEQLKKTNAKKRRNPNQNSVVNIVFQDEISELLGPAKRTRKKITKLRPTEELLLTIGNNANGNSTVSPTDEVVCIDDDDDNDGVNKKIAETNTQKTIEPPPLVISNVISVLVPDQIDKSQSNALYSLEQTLTNDRSDSPVSVILMIEEDNQSENENKHSTSSAAQSSITPKTSNENKDVIEIIDDDPPASSSMNEIGDTFVCHLCSKVITGQEGFVEHMKKHKENSNAEVGSALLTLSSPTAETLLCHICYQMIEGVEHFSEHLKTCKAPGLKITAERHRNGFRCNDCGEICTTKLSLIDHVKLKHMSSTSLYICGVCCQEFPNSDSLSAHVNMCECLRYQCKVCGEDFITQNDCDFHMEQCHNKCKLSLAGTSRLLT